MARDESSREDLLREATALVERIELVLRSSDPLHIVAGFRRDGALSIFFDDDPVYQFNAAGELRRAFCSGKLVKAMNGRLVALDRLRTPREVQLVRHELSREEETTLLGDMKDRLQQLSELVNAKELEVVGQVPAEADVLDRLKKCLAILGNPKIAAKPNA